MPTVATARANRLRPIAGADDAFAAAALLAEVCAVDDATADVVAGMTAMPFEIAEDGLAASYKLYAGTDRDATRAAVPVDTLFVSRPPHVDASGAPLPLVKGIFTVTSSVLVPNPTPPSPVTSSVTLIVPATAVPAEVPSTSNAIVMTTTVLV